MSEKTLNNIRIINKHDVEENWLKATGFTPKQGEIIIYDIDETHSYERIKIGDGETNVNNLPFCACSWNDLTDVPFGDYGDIVVAWNRSIANEDNHVVVLNMDVGEEWHKRGYYYVSDLTPSHEDIVEGYSITLGSYGYPFNYSEWSEMSNEISNYTDDYTFVCGESILIVRKDNVSIATIDGTRTFPKAGIYFFYEEMKNSFDAFSWYISKLTFKGDVKTLDEQLIPSTIARISDVEDVKNLIGDVSVSEQISAVMSAARPKITTVTLLAANWAGNSNPYSQVITVSGATEDSKIDLQPTAIQIVELQNCETTLMLQNDNGVVTAWAIGNKPTQDYSMQVLITEVVHV